MAVLTALTGGETVRLAGGDSVNVQLLGAAQTVTDITPAQLALMATTPIVLVPALGPNNVIVVSEMICYYTRITASYATVGSVSVAYDPSISGLSAVANQPSISMFQGATSNVCFSGPLNDIYVPASILNAAVVFYGSSNWTLGSGTIRFIVRYFNVPLV